VFFQILSIFSIIVVVASIITAATPTPDDEKLIGKVYKIIEVLALNICHAKDSPSKSITYYTRRRAALANALKGKSTEFEEFLDGS